MTGLPLRSNFLNELHAAAGPERLLTRESVTAVANRLRIPVAEAWEAATSYPDFHFDPVHREAADCGGLSCRLARGNNPAEVTGCQFRCYEAPASLPDSPFPEEAICAVGPLLAPDVTDHAGLQSAAAISQEEALSQLEASELRGRGGAYFPTATKWRSALAQQRPIALVINAEEGEPGVFKDRAVLCQRPRRFLEGLAIAATVLKPEVLVIFINGEAEAAHTSLEATIASTTLDFAVPVQVVRGGGGYVLGEESTLLNALEGRKPAPRLRPPYPVESGLFGMPTVINNVETVTNLSCVFRGVSPANAKLFSVSGCVARPGLYEMPLGTPIASLIELAGARPGRTITGALMGGPSGGFLPASEFGLKLEPGLLDPTGAVTGSGGIVVLDDASDIRDAAIQMARFNAAESCGKCTPCREGLPRLLQSLEGRETDGVDALLEVVGAASLCGLGQMAPGPIRSAMHFWPELFR